MQTKRTISLVSIKWSWQMKICGLIKSSIEEEEEEISHWAFKKFDEIFNWLKILKKNFGYDRVIEKSFKVTHLITKSMGPFPQSFDELKSQKLQLPITMFFRQVNKGSTVNIYIHTAVFHSNLVLPISMVSLGTCPLKIQGTTYCTFISDIIKHF